MRDAECDQSTSVKPLLKQAEAADRTVASWFAPWQKHPFVRAAGLLGEMADQPPLYAYSLTVIAAGLARGDKRFARAGMRMLAAQWLATQAKKMVKHRIDRTRPRDANGGAPYRMEPGDSRDKAFSSFPSGHTAGAVAVARAYASEYPEHAWAAGLAATLAGAIQIPRCAHYPTDIAAGAAIGWVAGGLVARPGVTRQPRLKAST